MLHALTSGCPSPERASPHPPFSLGQSSQLYLTYHGHLGVFEPLRCCVCRNNIEAELGVGDPPPSLNCPAATFYLLLRCALKAKPGIGPAHLCAWSPLAPAHLLSLTFAAHVIAKAKGLAVLSVIKAGFLVTARGGSGVVLARLPDGSK